MKPLSHIFFIQNNDLSNNTQFKVLVKLFSLLFVVIVINASFFQKNMTGVNIADGYDDSYPVTFNIVLWLMILMGITVFAICYGIWNMDPGRDSIIYRMTTTRLKKD